MAELSVQAHTACDEAHSGSVLQGKDHEIMNEGAKCVQSENVMQFLHHHEPAAMQQIA